MKVVISNFSKPLKSSIDFGSFWRNHEKPNRVKRVSLFDQEPDWGFHIYALGVYLMDLGIADEVEFWDYTEERSTRYLANGLLKVTLHNDEDAKAYLERYGFPDFYMNHGKEGLPMVQYLNGKCFTVHVPALKSGLRRLDNYGADCYLVDSEEFLDERSMMYIPVVNTKKIFPLPVEKERDFIYLAANYLGKRHDIVINSVRGTNLTGHFHPVDASELDLRGTNISTSRWNEVDVVHLLRTSRFAAYPADNASSPAAMWECVAAGLPIILNEKLRGGKHLVVPGVTGEIASEENYYEAMRHVLSNLHKYRPREYFEEHWDTVKTLNKYLSFFERMGWTNKKCS
jgi:hypothetical protein